MNGLWSFNRSVDGPKIVTENLSWQGPFSWPMKGKVNTLPDIHGVYLLTFPYMDGYVLYCAGITNSTKRRFSQHTRAYKNGEYSVLCVESAIKGERQEIWHGWEYNRAHRDEFLLHKKNIIKVVDIQLNSFQIFIVEIKDKRKRERLEAALMFNIYVNKEPWAELADRGMSLRGRHNSEIPIVIKNNCPCKIRGVPGTLEI